MIVNKSTVKPIIKPRFKQKGIELLDCARLFENEVDKEILNLELDFNNHAISQEDSRLGLAVNFDYGRVVGADTIVGLNNQQFYLVLKEFGTIQVWSLEDSRIVNRLNLNQKVWIMLL